MEVVLEQFLSVFYVIALLGYYTQSSQRKQYNRPMNWLLFVSAWVGEEDHVI